MSIVNDKLEQLKRCLGEKKLKQLGIIPCTTCQKILIQAASFTVPSDISNKIFLTSEEMSTINQTVAQSITQNMHPEGSDDTSDNYAPAAPVVSADSTLSITQEDLNDEAALLKKLASILKYSQPANAEMLDSGYIYNCPTTPLPHSLTCTECGRLYAIAHPTLEILPLPIYLSDAEYELIKGIYVDILL